MADVDFNINIRTLADLTGIKLTEQQLKALQHAAIDGNKEAISTLKQLSDAQKQALGASSVGLTGSAVGLGTIVTLLTSAISKWRAFNDEQDKWVEGMIKAQEKSRELGLSVADMLDAMKSAERIDTEPLQVSFDRLKQKVIELKQEMKLAFAAGEYEDVKRYAGALGVVESQLHRVTSALDQKAKASAKAAEEAQKDAEASAREAQDFLTKAVQTSQPQTQAVLRNEEAARQARAAGREKEADLFQKTADQLKASMSQAQREEYEGLTAGPRLGPKAGPGESQSALDDIARNQINFQRQLQGQPPLPGKGEAGGAGGNQDLTQAIQQAFDAAMAKYWGP